MLSKTLNILLIVTLLLAPNAQAFEVVIPGLVGRTNERPIFVPEIGTNGLPNGNFDNFPGNISLLYVNCRTRVAVAKVVGNGSNLSGRPVVLRGDPTVASCVATDAVNLINQVCLSSLSVNDIANAMGVVTAVYAYPRRNISRVSISAVIRLP